MRVLAIPGSLRNGSYNRRLLLHAAELVPEGVEVALYDDLRLVPPFDEDDEIEHRLPEAVRDLRRSLSAADALLFATPEYNHSIPGQLKNAVDWASRPTGAGALRGKPAAVIGASTGAFGAVWAQAELRKVLGAAGARVVDGEVALGHAAKHMDASNRIDDEVLEAALRELLEALVAEAETNLQSRAALAA